MKKSQKGLSDITAEEFKAWVFGIWDFRGESSMRVGHQAPFPRELPRRCIKLFSYVGDTILDPFVRSGTTIIEAINHQRTALGIELESHYCTLVQKRIEKECRLKLEKRQDRSIKNFWQA